jgi:hypothetical protein
VTRGTAEAASSIPAPGTRDTAGAASSRLTPRTRGTVGAPSSGRAPWGAVERQGTEMEWAGDGRRIDVHRSRV